MMVMMMIIMATTSKKVPICGETIKRSNEKLLSVVWTQNKKDK